MFQTLLPSVIAFLTTIGLLPNVVIVQREADTGQPITMLFTSGSGFAPNGTQYTSLSGVNASAAGTSEDSRAIPIPMDGAFQNLRCSNYTGASDSGENITLTLMENTGGSWADTSLSCTLTGAGGGSDTTCDDTGVESGVSAGHLFVFKQTFTGTPTNTEDCVPSVEFVSSDNNKSAIVGVATLNSTAIRYAPISGRLVMQTAVGDITSDLPDNFEVEALYIDTASNLTNARTFYVCYDDDGSTDSNCNSTGRALLSCQVSASGQTCNDVACDQGSCSVTAGNEIFLATNTAATAENIIFGWGIRLSNTSQRWPTFSYTILDNSTAVRYGALNFGDSFFVGRDDDTIIANGSMVSAQMYIWHDQVTSAGTTKTYTVFVNGAASAQECAINETNSTCLDIDDVTVTNGQNLTIRISPANTPGTNNSTTSVSWEDLN